MNQVTYGAYRRISKQAARNAYNNNTTIRIVPHKMLPMTSAENGYGMAFDLNKAGLAARYGHELTDNAVQFDTMVNDARFYNCMYETGYYIAYYIKAA